MRRGVKLVLKSVNPGGEGQVFSGGPGQMGQGDGGGEKDIVNCRLVPNC